MAPLRIPSPLRRALSARRAVIALALSGSALLAPVPAFAATAPAVVAPDHATQVAVDTALSELGKPYVWGAAGPGTFDCSGLTLYAYKAAGVSLPHSSSMQSTVGTPVARTALRPGDLVFFYGGGHVGIYIGNDEVVHAPTPGDVVKITKIGYMPFSSARRIA